MEPPSSLTSIESLNTLLTAHWFALFVLLMLVVSAVLISCAETAFFLLSTADVDDLRTKKTDTAIRVSALLDKPKDLLYGIRSAGVVLRLSIVVLLVACFFADTSLLSGIPLLYATLTTLFFGVLLLNILPRWLVTANPIRYITGPSLFLKFWIKILPESICSFLFFADFMNISSMRNIDSINSLSTDIDNNAAQSVEEKKMLRAILSIGDTEVKEVLCPRVDVTAVDLKNNFEHICTVVIESAYSRIPVYEDNFDNIKGILYVKDLLPYIHCRQADFNWQVLIREAYFVPEHKRVNDLLDDFQQKRIHMAIVVDEYGGTVGVVTLEDILEEIVGDILDESDLESGESYYECSTDGAYIFDGKTALNDFYRTMSVTGNLFDDIKGDAETLAGLLLKQLGKFPPKGAQFRIKQFGFTVMEADNRRILKIKVVNHEA